jgi:ribosome biogenesis GTPase
VGSKLIPLPDGVDGYLVDTPGLREVGVWGLPSDSLDQCFPEFRPMLGECRFQDCKHVVEPGCAVRAAVEDGSLDRGRYESYTKLRGELQDSEINVW